ncbi:NAD(P)/FAD-dependent oxidoreductase [Nubsella zeaxanthinifaciens]|uniref:NAD(P)/FAD-dependent oxidoreductase n=1 Tax=Nubsella zeaxanthinifaciens TaxID=392412 RepID=UPI000DE4E9C9|nr:NAD(P)/FAD-dependent oxidoreductase [Nubsella zeaxanthinifaciens]
MQKEYDVIIIGGSYAGLSAALSLARALKQVLVIDGGKPCNWQTPHSHNFLTQDGQSPKAISDLAKSQVLAYDNVALLEDFAVSGRQTDHGFEIVTEKNNVFHAQKLIFANGIKDQFPDIVGFGECWGISVIHCPYCHGYEVRNQKTGLLGNGEDAFEFAKLLWNWTKELTLFTNGKCALNGDQKQSLTDKGIQINEQEIVEIVHDKGKIKHLVFSDGSAEKLNALYARIKFEQHCGIPQQLGCEFTEAGLIASDHFQKTTVEGVYACGDNTSMMRSVANAVYSGNMAGAAVSKELIAAEIKKEALQD